MSSSLTSSPNRKTEFDNILGTIQTMAGTRNKNLSAYNNLTRKGKRTPEGVLAFLTPENRMRFGQVSRELRKTVSQTPLDGTIELPPEQTLKSLLVRHPGVVNIDVSTKSDITNEEFYEVRDRLGSIRGLNMSSCSNLDDSIFPLMPHLRELNILECKQLTNDAIKNLTKLTHLDMTVCKKITDDAFINLTNLKRLSIAYCPQITDNAFQYFENLDELIMPVCQQITDEGFKHLTNLKKLEIQACNQVTDKTFQYFKNLTSLNIADCDQTTITDKAFNDMNHLLECYTSGCSPEVVEAAKKKIAKNKQNKATKTTMEALDGGYKRRSNRKSTKRRSKKTRKTQKRTR